VATVIGDGRARAVDLVPAGSDPFSYRPDATVQSRVSASALLLSTGDEVQPGFSSLDASADRISLSSTSSTDFWLDPAAMRSAVPVIEAAMEKADPQDRSRFRSGAHDLEVELGSTAIDYQSTLSTCPRRTIFAADNLFEGVAKSYNLDYAVLGPAAGSPGSSLQAEAAAVRASGATAVFGETWVPDVTVGAVATMAGVKVRTLDTLLAPPPGGWPKQATYLNLLEANLGRISDALGCAASSSGP
jgi:ABC-type Zn uptake system ZnuABC Zn-binding protein ZnuA